MKTIDIYPDTIPIIFSSNDYFVPYMSSAMQSVMENADSGKRYAFFVLHRDITDSAISLLTAQIAAFTNFSIDFINVFEELKDFQLFTSGSITIETYFRLLIPELFSSYEKVIYLDCDLICCTDIAELYKTNLGDNLLAAVGC